VSRVVIEGPGPLAVTTEDDQPDPKRRRPAAYATPAPAGGLTWEQVVGLGKTNPFWSREENDAADARRRW
jgi:hypothetical protein